MCVFVCARMCACMSTGMCFCSSFFPPLSDFASWLTFLPLQEFGKAVRFFLLHDFQQCSLSFSFSLSVSLTLCSSVALSLPLTLCLLWLLTNRFHMLLQLTSVLNYFTCDLRYFLRKSVRYVVKANKINLTCCHFHLSISCLFFFLPQYCVPYADVLLSEAGLSL